MHLPYVYKLTDTETGMWYIGSRTSKREKCHPNELGVRYFTSSRIIKPLFTSNPNRFIKEVIVSSCDQEFIIKVEASILSFRNAKDDPLSYNMHNGDGKMNTVKSGAISGHIVGKRMFEEKTGLFSQKFSGKGGKVGGKRTYNDKLGCFARSPEQHSKDSKKAGEIAKNLKLGFHSWTFEQFSEHNKKNAKKLNLIRRKCNVCGKITTCGPMKRHQVCSGHVGFTDITYQGE